MTSIVDLIRMVRQHWPELTAMRTPAEAIVKARELRQRFVDFADMAERESGENAAEAAKMAREWIGQIDAIIENPASLQGVNPKEAK